MGRLPGAGHFQGRGTASAGCGAAPAAEARPLLAAGEAADIAREVFPAGDAVTASISEEFKSTPCP